MDVGIRSRRTVVAPVRDRFRARRMPAAAYADMSIYVGILSQQILTSFTKFPASEVCLRSKALATS